MRFKKNLLFFLVCFVPALFFGAGCAKKADPDKSIGKVIAEAETLSRNHLKGYVRAYSKAIREGKNLLDDLLARMRTLSPKDTPEPRVKALRAEALKLQIYISALTARYEIYARKFREKGGDISQFPIL